MASLSQVNKQASRFVRSGFTMIEMMVVFAIIGMILTVLLPAIQQAREAANRSQCKNNLRQLGLALTEYESFHQTYPGGITTVDAGGTVTPYVSPLVAVLPYVDQINGYNNYNFDLPWYMQKGAVATTLVPVLHCPSAAHDKLVNVAENGYQAKLQSFGGTAFDDGVVSTTDYVVSKGPNDSWCLPAYINPNPQSPSTFGMFDIYRSVRNAEIIDGTSNTIAIGEGTGGSKWKVRLAGGSNVPLPDGESRQSPFVAAIESVQVIQQTGLPHATCLYASTNYRINENPIPESILDDRTLATSQNCNSSSDNPAGSMATSNFRSDHVGGSHFLFADGSVRFVSDRIEMANYRALSTISGGEVVQWPE